MPAKQFDVLVGRAIRRARLNARMQQDELAAQLDCVQTTISRYEEGRRPLLARTLVDVAEALSVPVTALLPRQYVPEESDLDPDERALLTAWRRKDVAGLLRLVAKFVESRR